MQGGRKKSASTLARAVKPGGALPVFSLLLAPVRSRIASLLLLTPRKVSVNPGMILPPLFASGKSLIAADLVYSLSIPAQPALTSRQRIQYKHQEHIPLNVHIWVSHI